jgi:hypothetical protein
LIESLTVTGRSVRLIIGLALVTLLAAGTGAASAQNRLGREPDCWRRPQPETLEETFIVSSRNGRGRQAQVERDTPSNAVLLISNGGLKVAFSAGLVVGWGETGERPRFAAVTAVGLGALIAPFAFIGLEGDQAIGDIFSCRSDNLAQMAERAASLLDESVLAAIAREHDAGRRLLVALPGSAARPETIWDLGLLAKSGDAGSLPLARDVLRASVSLYTPVTPADALAMARQVVPRNTAFRQPGTGQEFLLPARSGPVAGGEARYFLIHNDLLLWDESASYIGSRKAAAGDGRMPAVMPGSDIVRQALAARSTFRFASPKSAGGLVPQKEFDPVYLKGLFRHAFRKARMDREWTSEFPGLDLSPQR